MLKQRLAVSAKIRSYALCRRRIVSPPVMMLFDDPFIARNDRI